MLDIKFIRQNSERVQRDAINKGYTDVNIEGVLKIDDERKVLSQKIDE
ncbi:serine--tRNA ligase, partial [Candidatus Saccharibacteria bacterium]|nr:serine--tRNA ligase [Bacilli bacterium]NCU34275.1 serine--tRNA ligase [Candidatus Saccharibacteria bacterium]